MTRLKKLVVAWMLTLASVTGVGVVAVTTAPAVSAAPAASATALAPMRLCAYEDNRGRCYSHWVTSDAACRDWDRKYRLGVRTQQRHACWYWIVFGARRGVLGWKPGYSRWWRVS